LFMEKPLVDKAYLLEKFPGKGGWTYALIPEVLPDKKAPFGWVVVKGSIDGVAFSKYHLMPMGNGHLFLPVKAEIRKKIRKQAGDYVHVILYADGGPREVPEELLQCLEDEPAGRAFFETLSEDERMAYVKWIYSARTEDAKVERMAQVLDRLARGNKMEKILRGG
jgi:hypothetical protein